MRSWIYFIAFVFFLGCVSNSLNRRKYSFLDSLRTNPAAGVSVPEAGLSHCMVKDFNFLDTCAVKYVKQLYLDTAAAGLKERLAVIELEDAELTEKIRTKAGYFYREKGLKTEWLELDAPMEQFYVFARQVSEAHTYGLNPDAYKIRELQAEIQRLYLDPVRTHEEVTDLDIRITGSFFLFTTHLIEGRIPTGGNEDFIWIRDKVRENDIQLLLSIKSEEQMRKQLAALHPIHPQYEKLKNALRQYRKLAVASRPFAEINISQRLTSGDRHPAIPLLRKRLALTDLTSSQSPQDSLLYDEHLAIAVRHFQSRHGLVADGVIGPNTIRQLNVSLDKKVELIELNLERLRWLPNDLPEDYISINVPEYKLRVYNRDKVLLDMRVVTGSSFTSTPVFSDTLEYVVFSPTWTVPYSIIENEFIPRLRKDSLYYNGRNYTFYKHGVKIDPSRECWDGEDLDVFAYKVVQDPGPSNALGLVKFIMPNNMYIYLHDTPAERLFNRNERALSHGCIRLEHPVQFARYLLSDNSEWDEKRITEAMRQHEPETVYLKRPFHVQIEYRSVWVDDEGLVHFRPDIYGHDQRQLMHLKNSLAMNSRIPDR